LDSQQLSPPLDILNTCLSAIFIITLNYFTELSKQIMSPSYVNPHCGGGLELEVVGVVVTVGVIV
jgi:hypothetical protein